MAKQSKTLAKALGLFLVIGGIGLFYWGYQSTETVGSQIMEKVSGSYSDKEMGLFIGGIASFIVGLFLFFKSK